MIVTISLQNAHKDFPAPQSNGVPVIVTAHDKGTATNLHCCLSHVLRKPQGNVAGRSSGSSSFGSQAFPEL